MLKVPRQNMNEEASLAEHCNDGTIPSGSKDIDLVCSYCVLPLLARFFLDNNITNMYVKGVLDVICLFGRTIKFSIINYSRPIHHFSL